MHSIPQERFSDGFQIEIALKQRVRRELKSSSIRNNDLIHKGILFQNSTLKFILTPNMYGPRRIKPKKSKKNP